METGERIRQADEARDEKKRAIVTWFKARRLHVLRDNNLAETSSWISTVFDTLPSFGHTYSPLTYDDLSIDLMFPNPLDDEAPADAENYRINTCTMNMLDGALRAMDEGIADILIDLEVLVEQRTMPEVFLLRPTLPMFQRKDIGECPADIALTTRMTTWRCAETSGAVHGLAFPELDDVLMYIGNALAFFSAALHLWPLSGVQASVECSIWAHDDDDRERLRIGLAMFCTCRGMTLTEENVDRNTGTDGRFLVMSHTPQ